MSAWCQTLSNAFFEVYEDVIEVLMMLEIFFAKNSYIKYLFYSASTSHETCLFFCNYFGSLRFESVENYSEKDFAWVTNETQGAVVVALFQVTFLW